MTDAAVAVKVRHIMFCITFVVLYAALSWFMQTDYAFELQERFLGNVNKQFSHTLYQLYNQSIAAFIGTVTLSSATLINFMPVRFKNPNLLKIENCAKPKGAELNQKTKSGDATANSDGRGSPVDQGTQTPMLNSQIPSDEDKPVNLPSGHWRADCIGTGAPCVPTKSRK
jgi:hypothetical protein